MIKEHLLNFPRPQFYNKNHMILDGLWDFEFDDFNVGEKEKWFKNNIAFTKKINVPFSFQTEKSGINVQEEHEIIWYKKSFKFNKLNKNQRLLLHFEGADYFTKIWVNGNYVGSHKGGYTRFSFDIKDYLNNNNEALIVVRCEDKKEATQVRGKQTWLKDPFGCWYLETNGLWKSVWCEVVNEVYPTRIKITPNFQDYTTEFEIMLNQFESGYSLKIETSFNGNMINSTTIDLLRRITNIKVDMNCNFDGFRVFYWTFDNPNLYDVNFTLLKNNKIVDERESYFAFRAFEARKNCLLLNMNPVYLKMALHQGYYRNSGLTGTIEDFKNDILIAKKLGLNGLRMHQKIEDERFFYLADTLGMLMWCEMPSAYEFKDETIDNYVTEWMEIVKQYYNHPSVVCWVPINESWGVPRILFDDTNKHLSLALYHLTKSYDNNRPVISNDGWEHTYSDIITLHNYTQSGEELEKFYGNLLDMLNGNNRVDYSQTRLPFAEGFQYNGQPVVISEFAGIGYQSGGDQGWGYGNKVSNNNAYSDRLKSLIEAIRKNEKICGFCITQLSDVYSEINGLLDFDRNPKENIDKLKEIITK